MMAPAANRRILLACRPQGMPREADFAFANAPIPPPREGELLLRAPYLSADPLQRVRMSESAIYGATIPLGTVVCGRQVGEAVESRHPAYRPGEIVEGMLGWQECSLSDGGAAKAECAPGLTRHRHRRRRGEMRACRRSLLLRGGDRPSRDARHRRGAAHAVSRRRRCLFRQCRRPDPRRGAARAGARVALVGRIAQMHEPAPHLPRSAGAADAQPRADAGLHRL